MIGKRKRTREQRLCALFREAEERDKRYLIDRLSALEEENRRLKRELKDYQDRE